MINTAKGNCEFTFIQDTRPGATFYVSVEIDSCSADDASFCLRSFHFVWQMNTVNYQLSGSLNDLQLNHETIQYYSKVSTNQAVWAYVNSIRSSWHFFDSYDRPIQNLRLECQSDNPDKKTLVSIFTDVSPLFALSCNGRHHRKI